MKLLSSHPLLALPAVTLAGLLASCVWMKPANKRLAESRDKVSHGYQAELQHQLLKTNQGRALDVTWAEALEKMYLSNPELIQADNLVEDARRQQSQVWRNMLPLLGVGAGNNFGVNDLASAFTSPQLRIYSYLPLGGLLQLPQEVYTRKLYYMGAALQAENSMRQQVIALYRIFQEQRLLRMEKQALDFEGQLVSGISGLEGSEVLAMKLKHSEALERWGVNRRQWNTKVGDFFMAGYDDINLAEQGLPDINYSPGDLDFADTGRWGMLQLNLLALEQIADDGRVLEAYLRYLPRANLSVSAPPLYASGSQGFAAEGINIGPSLDWNLDAQGAIGQQLKRLKSGKVIKDWRKDKRQRDEIGKLLQGREALGTVQSDLAKLRQAQAGYQNAVKAGLVKDPKGALQTMRKLREMEVRLAAKEIEICSSFWLIDEQRWTPITRRWLQTRESRAKKRK